MVNVRFCLILARARAYVTAGMVRVRARRARRQLAGRPRSHLDGGSELAYRGGDATHVAVRKDRVPTELGAR